MSTSAVGGEGRCLTSPRNIEWLWPNRFVKGRINLIVGMGDVGKDTFLCRCAASLTNRIAWPDDLPPPPGRVGIISPEDEPHDTIVPRLIAAGANLSTSCDQA